MRYGIHRKDHAEVAGIWLLLPELPDPALVGEVFIAFGIDVDILNETHPVFGALCILFFFRQFEGQAGYA